MRSVSDRGCRENPNTHFMFSDHFSENCAVYEIIWKNMVQPERLHVTVWRMGFAGWIIEARIQTHLEYLILTAVP